MKKFFYIILAIILLLPLTSCQTIMHELFTGHIEKLNEKFSMDLPNLELLYYNNPHSFRGDGVFYYVFHVKENQKEKLLENEFKSDCDIEKYIKDTYNHVLSGCDMDESVPEEYIIDFEDSYVYLFKTYGDSFTCFFDKNIKYREICYFLYFESTEKLCVIRDRP